MDIHIYIDYVPRTVLVLPLTTASTSRWLYLSLYPYISLRYHRQGILAPSLRCLPLLRLLDDLHVLAHGTPHVPERKQTHCFRQNLEDDNHMNITSTFAANSKVKCPKKHLVPLRIVFSMTSRTLLLQHPR